MPRRRWIDPSFWDDYKIGRLNPAERLFFLGCISHADDEGRLTGNAAELKGMIFPFEGFTYDEVRKLRNSVVLAMEGSLILYRVGNSVYLALRNWRRYQRPRPARPSILPAPPDPDVVADNAIPEWDLYVSEWEQLRRVILERDGYICQYCGESPGEMHVDHIVPRSKGGEHNPENLVAACADCNAKKGARMPKEAGMELIDG